MTLELVTPKNERVAYNDALHKYTIDGRTVPSITQVCYSNVDDFMFTNRNAFNTAANFGTAVHDLCHEHNLGQEPDYQKQVNKRRILDRDIDSARAHVEQYKRILAQNDLTVVGSEILLYSIVRKVAGRSDGIVRDARGYYWIYDIKTGQLDVRAQLQMAGYKFMAEELFNIKIKGGIIFKLTGSNLTPKLIKYDDPSDVHVFHCKLVSLQWDIANMGKKV